jgi:F420-dependent oxidoreductase-like protein
VKAPIRLGLQLPRFEVPDTPPERLFERLAGIAEAAEASGFDSFFVMDHLHQIAGVGPETGWMLEGNTLLGALAARTRTLNLSLLVGGVTYRNPALLAKVATTLDVISGGRAILGIGAAWFEDEHLAYGFDFPPLKERFERLEEALQICRAMFTEHGPSFHGRHYRIEGALNNPRPIRGDIPILVGGSGERKTLRLVAQYADGCNIVGDPERVRHLLGVLRAHCEAVGRDPDEITKTRHATVSVGRTHEEAERRMARWPERLAMTEERRRMMIVCGDRDGVAEQVHALLDAGLDGLTVNMPDPYDAEAVALVGETVGGVLRAYVDRASRPGGER